MNTILTDDEIEDAWCKYGDEMGGADQSDALRIGREIEAAVLAKLAQQEPFGYFRAEPFGWTDCAESDEDAVPLYAAPVAQQADRQRVPSRAEIREVFLVNGFTVKDGQTDLKPYVYAAAHALLNLAAAPEAPAQEKSNG